MNEHDNNKIAIIVLNKEPYTMTIQKAGTSSLTHCSPCTIAALRNYVHSEIKQREII